MTYNLTETEEASSLTEGGGAFPWKRRLNPSESRFLSGT